MITAKILIVEDEPAIADNLAALLTAKGHKAATCCEGAEGVERARKENFDLILLDVMLPRMSGFDVCKMLRSDPKTTKIKIIMVTGLGRMGDVEEAFRAGADDYLIKPFDSARLFKKIEKVLATP
ncbi:MAG: two-component system response regulator [Elusimicrobia bacterium CG11_big_fil_rev_8_21_14_0_20_64_6]|nr:MAG: two-component system response regulator [Elusimicrobia bacterium CG11_big_fil_rev_8_21_14_0_20_64_6]